MNNHSAIKVVFAWVTGVAALFSGSLCQAQSYNITTIADELNLVPGSGLAVDTFGNLYIADTGANLIFKVTPGGVTSVVAGDVNNNGGAYYGDGGQAIGAGLNTPYGVAVDSIGNLYIADFGNSRIRKVSTNGIISTVAGGGSNPTLGGLATQTFLGSPVATAIDAQGNIFIGINLGGGASAQVLKVTLNGVITAFAGGGSFSLGNLGDGGPATSAFLTINGLAVDAGGNLYIADAGDSRIRKVSTAGTITTVAGSNTSNYSGDGGPAISAGLNHPYGVAVDTAGNLYITDSGDYRVREVTTDGTINSIAGTGKPGNAGDGGPAMSATFTSLYAVAVGNGGVVYITDYGVGSVRALNSRPAFFTGETPLTGGVYYLAFADSNFFGYYNYVASSIFYHYDMGYEAFIPGSTAGTYFYDFAASHWFYTSSTLFPYLYDFTLNTWIYYFPDTSNPGHYTRSPRYFSNLATGKIFTM